MLSKKTWESCTFHYAYAKLSRSSSCRNMTVLLFFFTVYVLINHPYFRLTELCIQVVHKCKFCQFCSHVLTATVDCQLKRALSSFSSLIRWVLDNSLEYDTKNRIWDSFCMSVISENTMYCLFYKWVLNTFYIWDAFTLNVYVTVHENQ